MSERPVSQSAVVLLETKNSFILERRPNLPGKLAYPDKLQFFGGGVEDDERESPAKAAVRELDEELRLKISSEALSNLWSGEYEGEDKHGQPVLRHVSVYYLGLTAVGRARLTLQELGSIVEIPKTQESVNLLADQLTPFALRTLSEFIKNN